MGVVGLASMVSPLLGGADALATVQPKWHGCIPICDAPAGPVVLLDLGFYAVTDEFVIAFVYLLTLTWLCSVAWEHRNDIGGPNDRSGSD